MTSVSPDRALGRFVRTALFAFLVIGGPIGLSALLAPLTGRPLGIAHRLLHAHLQTAVFLGGFVLGVGLRFVPQLSGRQPGAARLRGAAAWAFAGAALAMVVAVPFQPWYPAVLGPFVAAAAGVELAVWLLFAVTAIRALAGARHAGPWRIVCGAGVVLLLAAAAIQTVGWTLFALRLAPGPGVAALFAGWRLFLFSGVPLLALGVAGRVLRRPGDGWLAYGAAAGLVALLGAGAVVPGAKALTGARALGLLALAGLLPVGLALPQQATRLRLAGFRHGVWIAFGFVGVYALLDAAGWLLEAPIPDRERLHVWAVGFLTTLVVAFGSWLVPAGAGASAVDERAVRRAVSLLAGGTLLRVGAYLAAGGDALATLSFGGGLLQYAGVAAFAMALRGRVPS